MPNSRFTDGVRYIQVNEIWLNTQAIESVRIGSHKQVELRTVSGEVIVATGAYSLDTFNRFAFGPLTERHEFS